MKHKTSINQKQNEPVMSPRIPLREVFPEERYFFSPFVAAHISELGNAIGKQLCKGCPEQKYGTKTVDVTAEVEGTGQIFVVESQLSMFDHSHLSRTLNYTKSVRASGAVLLAPQFPDEILDIVRWLNENTHQAVEFYAVEVQAFQIGNAQIINFHCLAGPRITLDNLTARQLGYALQPIEYSWGDSPNTNFRVGHWKDVYGKVLLYANIAGVDLKELSLNPDGQAEKPKRVPHPITIQSGLDTLYFDGRGDSAESQRKIGDVLNLWGRSIVLQLVNGKRLVLPRPDGRIYSETRLKFKPKYWLAGYSPMIRSGRKFLTKTGGR